MLLLLLLACDDTPGLVDCASVAPEDCAERRACTVLNGSPVTFAEDGTCFDLGEAEPKGCMDASVSCPPSLAYGTPPDGDGTCFEFAAGCAPDGWSACEPDPGTVGECP